MGHFMVDYRYNLKSVLRLIAVAVILLWGTGGFAQEGGPAQASDPALEKIQIRSDSLVADNQSKVAEFIGNVKASQGDTVIESDRLKVYYGSGGRPSADPEDLAAQVEKIVASGNVRIRFENRLAVAQEAVYNVLSQVFILSGEGTRVTSGSSYIVGKKITLRRKDGQVVVIGGKSEQVEAVFYPEDAKKQPSGTQPDSDGAESSSNTE